MSDALLVTMRWAETRDFHPRSTVHRLCPQCRERVVVSPSGEEALAKGGVTIRCTRCYVIGPKDTFHVAEGFERDDREWRESKKRRN